MSRRSRLGPGLVARGAARPLIPLVAMLALAVGGTAAQGAGLSGAPAQPEPTGKSPSTLRSAADASLEAYLEQHGLKALLAEHLGGRINEVSGDERERITQKLSGLYVELISSAATPEQRSAWEARARELIKRGGDAQTVQLRLDLSRSLYAAAEDAAERWRLRLIEPAERDAAERDLRTLKLDFDQLAADLNRRVEAMERGAMSRDQDLAEVRRQRAVANYYAGWTGYYLAFISGDHAPASESLKALGWVLGRVGGAPATIDKLPLPRLKNEDVCRAAIAAALCHSLAGNDAEALRWLDKLAQSNDVPASIKPLLFTRRMQVLAQARRLDDLEAEVRAFRRPAPPGAPSAGEPQQRLDTLAARLLAVLAFEAGEQGGAAAQRLGQVAYEDLMAGGQLAHVLDLSTRYGTEPLGQRGFIAHYVRGATAYARARQAHEAEASASTGPKVSADDPATDPATINRYREAASMLGDAGKQDDVGKYNADLMRAMMLRGRALYYAGDLEPASEAFAQAAAQAQALGPGSASDAQEALWLAVVSMDALIGKDPAARGTARMDRLDELSTLFVRLYPQSPRAAQLLINQRTGSRVKDEEAVKTLLSVAKDAPIYEASRRAAARVLYRLYRGAPGDERSFAAARFVAVAEEVLGADRRAAAAAKDADAKEAGTRVVTTARQLLDALLSSGSPDVQRAQAVLEVVESVAALNALDLSPFAEELQFRRFQVLLARGDIAGAERLADQMAGAGAPIAGESGGPGAPAPRPQSRFAASAQRALYLRAVTQRKSLIASTGATDEAREAAARDVLKYGVRVVEQFGSSVEALRDSAAAGVYAEVADAAGYLAEERGDSAARDLAIRLDRLALAATPGQVGPLRRLGVLSEQAGDLALAEECWRTLASGLTEGSPDWFGARFNLIRLIMRHDEAQARTLMQQLATLYPDLGPAPWNSRLRSLAESLGTGAGTPGTTPGNVPAAAPASAPGGAP